MKLDPGMHIGMHLVFFGKAGVTGSVFKTFEELEAVAARLSSSQIRKNVERSKLFIKKLSETSSQKSKKYLAG
jgi:hypothetical protein